MEEETRTTEQLIEEFPPRLSDELFTDNSVSAYYTTPETVVLTFRHPLVGEKVILHASLDQESRLSLARFLALTPEQVHQTTVRAHQEHPEATEDQMRWAVQTDAPAPYLPVDIQKQYLTDHPEFLAELYTLQQAHYANALNSAYPSSADQPDQQYQQDQQ